MLANRAEFMSDQDIVIAKQNKSGWILFGDEKRLYRM